MIDTARLILRKPQLSDVLSLFEFLGNPTAMQFTHVDASLKQCRQRVAMHEWRRRKDGYAPWTIILKSTGRIIGWGGLYDDPFDPGWGVELGYYFHPDAWGQGYGSELALAALKEADQSLMLPKVGAFAHPENKTSRRLLEKVGFKVVRFVPEMERFFFERPRSEEQTSAVVDTNAPLVASRPEMRPPVPCTSGRSGVRPVSPVPVSPVAVDFLEAGSAGPVVLLVHSSVSGARQWRRLMEDLQPRFRVRAVNLFGYGKTPPWPAERRQTLADQAGLVEAAIPADVGEIFLVGHSFGGSVAMKAAARLGSRVARLVLLETNPFYLLEQAGRTEAFAEIAELRDCMKSFGGRGDWTPAAERFADYWGGAGTWAAMPAERRTAFIEALKPNFFEWDAVMSETTPAEAWAHLLPAATLLVSDPATVLPIREIDAILRAACPAWQHSALPGAGHMAPLTRPNLVNPLVAEFFAREAARPGA